MVNGGQAPSGPGGDVPPGAVGVRSREVRAG